MSTLFPEEEKHRIVFPEKVSTIENVKTWLNHYYYWGMKELPNEVYVFILSSNTIDNEFLWCVPNELFQDFPDLRWIFDEKITKDSMTKKQKKICFEKGFIKIIHNNDLDKNNLNYCSNAAKKGHLHP